MSSRTAERSLSEHCRKVFPERSEHSLSSHASPPRIGTWPSGRSLSMKSMNSGTPASVALPERSSRGITRSTSIRTVSHSWGVKNVGAYGEEGGGLQRSARQPCRPCRLCGRPLKRRRHRGHGHRAYRFAPFHKLLAFSCVAMYSDVRHDSAMIVQVGFLSACDVNGAPSATKRFL